MRDFRIPWPYFNRLNKFLLSNTRFQNKYLILVSHIPTVNVGFRHLNHQIRLSYLASFWKFG